MLVLARKFSLFSDIHALNSVVNRFKETVRGFVPKSVNTVIDFLATHSAKVKGVSFATYDYMADKTGLSPSTLKRAIKRLKDLGFIQVVNVWVDGRQRANIYQIQANIDFDELAKRLMAKVRFEFFDAGDDTQEEPQEDTQNDTLSKTDKPRRSKGLTGFFRKRNSKAEQASKTLKDNIYTFDSEDFRRLLLGGSVYDDDPFSTSIFRR